MNDRPTPPDPFARKASAIAEPTKSSLSEALSAFTPKPIDTAIPLLTSFIPNAPDTGRAGRPRRRGDPETRSRTVNFRMKPSEQAQLNALCDALNKSIPDTIMVLLEHYQKTAER
jgi:hypothetical protein